MERPTHVTNTPVKNIWKMGLPVTFGQDESASRFGTFILFLTPEKVLVRADYQNGFSFQIWSVHNTYAQR